MTGRRTAILLAAALLTALAVSIWTADARTARSLNAQARWEARHGGIHGTCHGCASYRMRLLSLKLVRRTFPPWARAWAQCIVLRESGANVGAISPTADYGLAQIHVAAHPEYSAWKLTHDPVYSVRAFHPLSRGGRDRQPWHGGTHPC